MRYRSFYANELLELNFSREIISFSQVEAGSLSAVDLHGIIAIEAFKFHFAVLVSVKLFTGVPFFLDQFFESLVDRFFGHS